ncbi:MAG: hypothetical protein JSU68_09415 [Phycisphaerales bacterium]|nr:MAG: hypothetical protein JSU68_09415 [Phycisphaerales bacterium]
MLNRVFAVCVILLWAGSMTALFVRDVWPAWTAQDLPRAFSRQSVEQFGGHQQFGIFTASGARLGTSWTRFFVLHDMRSVEIAHLIERLGDFGPLLINTDLKFTGEDDRLTELNMQVRGAPFRVVVLGELLGNEIVCDVQVGLKRRAFHIDADIAGLIGESLRPFSMLPELRVGQTWRLYMVDPLALMLGGKAAPKPVIVRVTRRERITHQDRDLDAFVVEWPSCRSWVDEHGGIVRTEMDIPLIGRIIIRSEPFDADSLSEARQRVPVEHGYSPLPDDGPWS